MSHMGSYACTLSGKVDLGFLEAAMQAAASDVLGSDVKMVKDFTVSAMDSSKQKCLFGFRGYGLSHGIGVAIENDKVMFFGDDYGVEKKFSGVRDKTQQIYTALAFAKIARDRGMPIQNLKSTDIDTLLLSLDTD